MTAHLLAVTVGPVQEFIAAARRTRDLWFASYLLSEISKAVAKNIRDGGGTLIFPAPSNANDLEYDSPLNVANVILAELTNADPTAVAKAAKEAARARWRHFADRVRSAYEAVINHDVWNDQVDDVIEFYAAWVHHEPKTYQTDRARLMRLLAGRKSCRDFLPAIGQANIPKSSLDGLRESVFRQSNEWPEYSRRQMRLRDGEQLDAVGMVKRLWAPHTGNPSYPSVARVAADPWLRGIGKEKLRPLVEVCEKLDTNVLHRLDTTHQRGHPHYASFPFEGTVVFRSRHRDLQSETELAEADLKQLRQELTALTQDFGEPNPYLGVLVADGDKMGEILSNLASAKGNRAFSQALADFANKAHEVVHDHGGVLIYAGGDDVLAFLPVDQCVACARGLYDAFGKAVASIAGSEPSLSVGVAIGHFMEPLEDLLAYGRAAEKHAKRQRSEDGEQEERNALAVHIIKRGGGAVTIRDNWSSNPDQRLRTLAIWIDEGSVSGRVAYDLHAIASIYDKWPPDNVRDAIQRDVIATMKRKEPTRESKTHEIERLVRERVEGADSLRQLGNELLVARQIALALGQARDDTVEGGSLE